jgi:hypothetical protein
VGDGSVVSGGPAISRTRLQTEWALCAIAAAAARFVPVPLVDDAIKERATRTAVTRTWAAHGRPSCGPAIDALTADSTGFLAGLARSASRLPITLVLFPFRKVARWIGAARGVSRDLSAVLLLARCVDRSLAAGWCAGTDPEQLRREALLVRTAHDRAVAGTDLRVLRHAVGGSLRRIGGLRRAAVSFARNAFARAGSGRDGSNSSGSGRSGATSGTAGDLRAEADPRALAGARAVQAVLAQPDVAGVLAEVDRRFDAALAALGGGRAGRVSRSWSG